MNGSRLLHKILKKSLLSRLPEDFSAGLEERDQTLCRSLDCVPRITGKRQKGVGNHLQDVGVSAAGCKRCGDLVRRQVAFQKFPRLAWKQNRKGRTPKIRGPYLVQNIIVPCPPPCPYDRVREALPLHELA